MPKPTPPRPAAQSPADIAAAALSGFQASRRDRPAPPPPSATSVPQGIPVQDLVRHAAEASRARVGGPAPVPRPAETVLKPAVPMPDLGESRDRLKSVLSEIEEAAARARAWRPDPRRK